MARKKATARDSEPTTLRTAEDTVAKLEQRVEDLDAKLDALRNERDAVVQELAQWRRHAAALRTPRPERTPREETATAIQQLRDFFAAREGGSATLEDAVASFMASTGQPDVDKARNRVNYLLRQGPFEQAAPRGWWRLVES